MRPPEEEACHLLIHGLCTGREKEGGGEPACACMQSTASKPNYSKHGEAVKLTGGCCWGAPREGGGAKGTHLAARGTEGAIRGDSDCVDVAGVAHQIAPQLAVGQVPHLHHMTYR